MGCCSCDLGRSDPDSETFRCPYEGDRTPAGDVVAQKLVASLARGVTLAVAVQRGFAERDTAALSRVLPTYITSTLALNKRVVAYGFRRCGAGT